MKLCSRRFVLYCQSRPKDDRSRHFEFFWSPFWGSWGRRSTLVDGSLESPCRVLVKRNWTYFSISYGWGATRQNVSRLAAIRRGRPLWANTSEGRGRPWGIFLVSTKLDTFCYLIVQTAPCYVPSFWYRRVTDRRTVGQTDGWNCYS